MLFFLPVLTLYLTFLHSPGTIMSAARGPARIACGLSYQKFRSTKTDVLNNRISVLFYGICMNQRLTCYVHFHVLYTMTFQKIKNLLFLDLISAYDC
jgi:hypothetical protein